MTGEEHTSHKRTRFVVRSYQSWGCEYIKRCFHSETTTNTTNEHARDRGTETPDRKLGTLDNPSDHKFTRHQTIKHVHMCTDNNDNSERLQCRRAYRVLSARFGHGICFGSVVCATIQNLHTHICTTLHTALLLVPQRQFKSQCHTRIHSQP